MGLRLADPPFGNSCPLERVMKRMKTYRSFDEYLKEQSPKNQAIIRGLRRLVKRVEPGLSEAVKWGNGCWVGSNGPVAYVYSAADYVQFGFFRGSSLKDPRGLLEGEGEYEKTAFYIHSRIHLANARATCVLHTHMPYATALTLLEGGRLEMAEQNALRFHDDIAYDDTYNGLVVDDAEGDRLARVLGGKRVMFLANHGVIVVGPTVAEAFDALYYLERACRLQVLARSMGGKLRAVRPEVVRTASRMMLADAPKYAGAHFGALKRIAEEGTPRLLTTLELEGNETPEYGAAVTQDGGEVGIVRSPAESPTLGRQIAMAAIDRNLNREGTEVEVALGEGTVKATVAMEFAASCRPLRKSNRRATPIRPSVAGSGTEAICALVQLTKLRWLRCGDCGQGSPLPVRAGGDRLRRASRKRKPSLDVSAVRALELP